MKTIKYYSTNLNAERVSFKDALLKGLAPDGGLYMPDSIPEFNSEELAGFSDMKYHEIAFQILWKFLTGEIIEDDLRKIVEDAYDFHLPLEKIYERKYVLRLDRGPTASFKDFAARLMGRLMQYYLTRDKKKILILTATSGDTGSAIANAFYNLDTIEIVVLFPPDEVTARQRKQMTTLGGNVRIIAVDGKFDDCQTMVKQAFMDSELNELSLSSANSINIGRLLPQSVYYFYAWSRMGSGNEKITFSVPSGNFGDIMGGLIAKRMGLPVERFVIATNENDEVPKYLESGEYSKIEPSKNCLSSAMNVGHPSNLARIIDLYGGRMDEKGKIDKQPDMERLRGDLYAVSISDAQTRETIKEAYEKYNLLLEPHGAVGWAALADYLAQTEDDSPDKLYVVLETAHPAKFPGEIERILNFDPDLPPSLMGLEDKREEYDSIGNDYNEFKKLLRDNYS